MANVFCEIETLLRVLDRKQQAGLSWDRRTYRLIASDVILGLITSPIAKGTSGVAEHLQQMDATLIQPPFHLS